MHIPLSIACSCFPTTTAEVNDCNRDHMAHTPSSMFCLTQYRSLLNLALGSSKRKWSIWNFLHSRRSGQHLGCSERESGAGQADYPEKHCLLAPMIGIPATVEVQLCRDYMLYSEVFIFLARGIFLSSEYVQNIH